MYFSEVSSSFTVGGSGIVFSPTEWVDGSHSSCAHFFMSFTVFAALAYESINICI